MSIGWSNRDLWRPGGSLPLLAALVAVFILQSLTTGRSPLLVAGGIALLLGSAYAMGRDRRLLIYSLILVAPTVLARVLFLVRPSRLTLMVSDSAAVAILTVAAGFVFQRAVAGEGRAWLDRVSGAICVYLLMGMIGAQLAAMIETLSPGSFAFPDRLMGEGYAFLRAPDSTYIYYSFVTLATLGYGDITPVSPPAQTFSWMLAVTGQMYVAIVVARLVSLGMTGEGGQGPASGQGRQGDSSSD